MLRLVSILILSITALKTTKDEKIRKKNSIKNSNERMSEEYEHHKQDQDGH